MPALGRGLYGGTYPYDAWCHHVKYDPRLRNVVKGSNPMYITIVRSPAMRFASAWSWYHNDGAQLHRSRSHNASLHQSLGKGGIKGPFSNTTLQDFIRKLAVTGTKFSENLFPYSTGLDATSAELIGNFKTRNEFDRKFDALLLKVKTKEWFFLVADRMDESLFVLAHELVSTDIDLSLNRACIMF